VSASGDNTIKVWNILAQKIEGQPSTACIATFSGHQTALVKVNWINLGLQIVSASVDGIAKIWNLKKQICVNTYEMHSEKIWGLDVQDNFMITGSGDSSIKVWRDCTVEAEKEEKEKELHKYEQE
jgi:U3 small nucleolar RNA-associated protein 13